MPESDEAHKNSLTIRLTESVVFVTPKEQSRGRNPPDSRTSMLRGLLTLTLVKPMRVSSIELELQGKARTAWPEGVGHRRIEVIDEHKLYSASAVLFRAHSPHSSRRATSVGPGLYDREDPVDELVPHPGTNTLRHNGGHTARSPVVSPRFVRRVSADSSVLQPNYHSYHVSRPPTPTHMEHSTVSDFPPSPTYASAHEDPAQTLEDLRRALHTYQQRSSSRGRNPTISHSPLNGSSASSVRSLSLRPHIEDVSENDPGPSHSNETSRSRWHSPESSPRLPTAPDRRNESRRRSGQFSLFSVPNAIIGAVKDHVRSSSRSRTDVDAEQVRGHSLERTEDRSLSRGRALEKGTTTFQQQQQQPRKELFSFPKFGDILKLDGDEKKKETGDGWKEFKKGTYTYPISFPIPGGSPPSLQCQGGSVTWCLKANVHRPGTFTPKLSALREVILIASPGEDVTEDLENVLIERHWDSQLQYLISISGRAFYIGGTMPIQFVLMPLAKIKVHRISVTLEEKVDYYIQLKRFARADPIKHFALLNLKYPDKLGLPILPLDVDDVDAFANSPLYALRAPDDDPSEMASSLMGPGPWRFQHDLRLPSSCSSVHFTTNNKKSNIVIHHAVKIIMRVERGDDHHVDSATRKRKLFDIELHVPVHILSCRCNPEWTSLPRYSESFEGGSSSRHCPCNFVPVNGHSFHSFHPSTSTGRPGAQESRVSLDSVTTAETNPINPMTMPSLRVLNTLLDRNTQFERLVSGQESEIGEAPPSYDDIPRSTSTRIHRPYEEPETQRPC